MRRKRLYILLILLGFSFLFFDSHSSARGQGNTVSGFVWGLERRPVPDISVELQNDLYVTIQRTRTSYSGAYQFLNVPGGRLRIRVMPYGSGYEEQDADIEIVNFTRDDGSGGLRRSGFSNEKRDFYLRPKKNAAPSSKDSIFVQEIPETARKLYDEAIAELLNKKHSEGIDHLKTALEIFPTYFDALNVLGTEYVRQQHFGAAEVLLSIAVKVNPRSYRSWYGLAFSQYSQKKYDSGLVASEKAFEISPASPENLFLRGVLLRRNNRFGDAEKALVLAKTVPDGPIPQVYWELALLYANNLGKYAEAAAELKSFLKAQPDAKDAENIKLLIAEFEAKAKAK